jgi:hypothetical protein
LEARDETLQVEETPETDAAETVEETTEDADE